MTSTTDEINNLRAALDHIRAWCAHEVKHVGTGPTNVAVSAVCQSVHDMAMRGLKTPRASKVFDTPLLDQSTSMDSHTPGAAHTFAPDNTFP